MKNTIIKNFSFQIVYQIIILVIPLIVSPFLTRRLGDTALGNYSYIHSISYYFVLFANLGIMKHGQRIISQSKTNDDKRKNFWSLYCIHAIISLTSVLFYLCFVSSFVKDNKTLFYIEIVYVISAIFDVTWLFYGLENFKSVVLRNAIIKIVETALIFIFIRQPGDLYLYFIITSCGFLLCNGSIFFQGVKIVPPIKFSKDDVFKHIKPMLVFFISVVAISLYTVFDKTLLGLMSSKENVAYYEYSNKIVSIPTTFIAVIGTVMYPRACRFAAEGDVKQQKAFINYSILATSFIGMAAFFGLFSVAELFVSIYYGEAFSECGSIIQCMCILPLVIGLGEVIRTQYLIPNKMDRIYTVCIVLNAVLNVALSVALIPLIGVYGAVVGTISAELFGTIVQLVVVRKFIDLKYLIKQIIAFFLIGLIMYFSIIFVDAFLTGFNGILRLLLDITIGALTYILISIFYIYLFEKSLFERLKIKLSAIIRKKLPFYREPFSKDRCDGVVERDYAIDFLRIVGILLILMAHTFLKNSEYSLLQEIRSFDVIAMVFVSGLSFAQSTRDIKTWSDYFKYVWKRFLRLILPCWIFLSIFFIYSLILSNWFNIEFLNLKTIFLSYSLISGIGYVWIIRVLFCLAIAAPFIKIIVNRIAKGWINIFIVLFMILLNSVLCYYSSELDGHLSLIVNTILLPVLGYSLVYWLAISYKKISFWLRLSFLSALIIFTIVFSIYNGFHPTGSKYPPTLVYITYGLSASIFLYELFHLVFLKKNFEYKAIKWLSTNSFTIYFAHIFIVILFDLSNCLVDYWWIEYLIIIFGSIFIAYLWTAIKKIKKFFPFKNANN